jgi:hypothetical protein
MLEFDSALEFRDYLTSTDWRNDVSVQYHDSARDWFGPDSWPDTLRKIMAGDEDMARTAESVYDILETGGIELEQHTWQADRAGAFPVVPDYVAGIPECMRRKIISANDQAPVSIYVDVAASAGFTAENLIKRGAAVTALAIALSQHRPISLYLLCGLDADNAKNGYYVSVKLDTNPIDLSQIAYLLGSPSVYRRAMMSIGKQYYGYRGQWPFSIRPGNKDAISALRSALRLEPQDLLVPAIYMNDDTVNNPIKWIQDTLSQYKQESQP